MVFFYLSAALIAFGAVFAGLAIAADFGMRAGAHALQRTPK